MPPQMPPQSDLQKLQNSINQMEERGMTNDPRYNQARQLQQSMMRNGGGPPGGPPGPYPGPPQSAPMPPGAPGPGGDGSRNSFQNTQMLQLRAQIMAYRFLARNQPLPPQIAVAVTGRRPEQQQPGGPGPQPGQPGYGAGSPMGPPNAQAVPGNANAGSPRPPPGVGGPQGQQPGQQGHQQQQQGPGMKTNRITPISKPAGIDPVTLLQERENRLASRVAHRIDELSHLLVIFSYFAEFLSKFG